MEVSQMLEVGIAFLALVLSYALQKAHKSAAFNAAIAGVAVLIAGAATVFVQGKLTGDVVGDVVLIVAAASALQAKSLAPLMQFLIEKFPVSSKSSDSDSNQPTITTPPTVKDLTTKQ